MNRIARAACIFVVCLSASTQTGAGEAVRVNASIRGATLKIIQAAMPKFEEQALELGRYEVLVVEEQSSFTVVFRDANSPAGQRGSTAGIPTFEVELGKKDLSVIRANFAR